MQKFLNYFFTFCAVAIGLIMAIRFFYGNTSGMGEEYLDNIGTIAEKSGIILNNVAPYLGTDAQASLEESLKSVSDAKREMNDLSLQAQKLVSPEKMRGMHGRFISSLKHYVDAFQLTEEGLQTGDASKFGRAGELLTEGAGEMQGVSEEVLRMAGKRE